MFQSRREKGNQKERIFGQHAKYNRRNVSKMKEVDIP
jgi:hypothetical protein